MTELGAGLGGRAVWSEPAVQLKDFAAKHPLPNLVRITKGQYRNIGVAKTVHSELYLHSIRTSKKVLAECVKIKDKSKQKQEVSEQKYSLPTSYQGWFEVLSEDGKAVKPLTSVQDLKRLFPAKCLVREAVKVYVGGDEGEVSLEKSRVLPSGEVLTLVSEVGVSGPFGRGLSKKRLLRCLDSHSNSVYLSLIKGLLDKFRLPLLVRLVHGIIPSRLEKHSFTGVFRLVSVYSDETAFVYPLRRDAKMVPVSTREPLKVQAAANFDEVLSRLDEVAYFHQRSQKMLASYMNSIHILVTLPDPQTLASKVNGQRAVEPEPVPLKLESAGISKEEEDLIFDEVDDIYAYVRDGGEPPKPRRRKPQARKESDNSSNQQSTDGDSGETTVVARILPPSADASSSEPTTPQSASDEVLLGTKVPVPEDNDWEEPIYEQIDKFQRARGKFEKEPDVMARAKSPQATRMRSPVRSQEGSVDSGLSGSREDLDERGRVGQVSSLRELYKQLSVGDLETLQAQQRPRAADRRNKSVEEYTDHYEAPPVPPKRFDLYENGQESGDTHVIKSKSNNDLQGMAAMFVGEEGEGQEPKHHVIYRRHSPGKGGGKAKGEGDANGLSDGRKVQKVYL